ncbi:DUF4336 domain-containing protein [Lutibaculum baratangense]|uniref:DUF4336 domain-containing protein n=1 Tax=Lutibaculum baratangense AMV1 TaxID=631454 RepID=V4RKI9_9HYPH|nr:DUF4336 domain-containing protein [Lutibaculum baratangense]ESR26571.1 hypothetical protein N177_0790 [Lutibaculum baratangense AMV1]
MRLQEVYRPLDTLKPVTDDVWIVDSGPHVTMGIPLPVRMTVIRLPDGELLLHSPTRYVEGLAGELRAVGPVRHIVLPNSAHWTHAKAWQEHYPAADTWAAPGLRDRRPVRRSALRIDRDLAEHPPAEWSGCLDQVLVRGAGGFAEIAFFHRPSRTLVLTDLVVNVPPALLPFPARLGARLVGATAPDGRAPAYLRAAVLWRRKEAAAAALRMIEWNPERVIFAHGDWFGENGSRHLRRSLAWLLD